MPIVHDNAEYFTMAEAAKWLRISRATLKRYLIDGKLPEPPRMRQATQDIRIFDEAYLKAARKAIDRRFQ